ncbi:amino acid adenylation domain-containing protein [Micromonospora sp. NPDC000207]|uniref:amino acid adenylation domain-containing protein n=1 Tax=Micromonospora sp. NPDC000207 TaxID=3154246 RepID=UPI003316DCCC
MFVEALRRAGADEAFTLVLTTTSRLSLPAAAADVVGPFTATAVFVAEPTAGVPLDRAARAVHDTLRRDLDHADVPGVAVLRELRARGVRVPSALPVVFTSLLDAGQGHAEGAHATSRTTGVTLDAQLVPHAGGVRVRWDVREEAYAPGVVAAVFAWFVNTLRWIGSPTSPPRPLNDLQQAYFVARATTGTGPWSGCQVSHGFGVDTVDLPRLERAWLDLVAAHEPLRTAVTHDGTLVVHETVPDRWYVPVTTGVPAEPVTTEMAGRAYPLGRLPQGELRVTVDPAGATTVHVAVDLLVADGRSIHLMMRDLLRRYADPDATPRVGAPPPPVGAPTALSVTAARRYWRDRLADLPPGPAVATTEGPRDRLTARITGWDRCRSRARELGLSLDAVILAVLTEALGTHVEGDFAVPLVRWTPQTEPLRPAELTALSWIPRAAPGTSVRDAARRYDELLATDAEADAVNGLSELRRLVLRRGGGYPVVCTGLLDFADAPLPAGVRAAAWATCTPDVGLDCIAIDEGDELGVYWDATRGAFPGPALAAVFEAYRSGLVRLTGEEDAWTTPPTVVDAAEGSDALPQELRRIVHDWNDTAVDFPHDGPVHLLFEEQVRLRPDAVAVRWRGGTASYREVNAAANRIAAGLRERGVAAGSVVAIRVPRGPTMVAAVFGVLKAGGAYLPVEPATPAPRVAVMLADAGAVAMVTVADAGPASDPVPTVYADRLGDAVLADPEPLVDADATAYVIFTSGSTGRPKGVEVAHRSVHNLLHWARRTFRFGPTDVGLCVTSLGFDLSVFDLLGLLSVGASVYVADADQQRDPALLLDVLLDEPITFWNSAPTTLAHLVPLTAAHRGRPGTDDLRLVFLSGDYTPLGLPDELRACFRRAEVVSLGGATEATVWSNWFRVEALDPQWHSIPYGRPIDNARYYVLDADRRPCPVGAAGDLYIAGEVLAVGYRNQPALTEDRFVPCPFGPPGDRMYRTGDRASFLPDGNICFLGRADHQVKIRGFRVEPGEIEHRLRTHPQVKDVVVLPREEGGERKLVAYVLPSPGSTPAVRDLRAYAAEALPDYMVPNHVAVLDRFPATANGKLDRDALPWPLTAPTASAPDVDGALREMVTGLFADLLGESVDPAGDLWDQGATSFTMVQVSARLLERLGTRIPVAVLLDNPTVDGIVAHVSGVSPASPASPASAASAASAPARATAGDDGARDADPTTDEVVDLLSPTERAEFAARRRHLREEGTPVELPDLRVDHLWYRWRSSRRDLLDRPVSLASVASLLALLRPDDGGRRLYPSAGDTYGVQVYLHVPGDRVTGLAAGVYYHHPEENRLRRIGDAADLDRTAHFGYNRPIFDRSAFGIYLVGQTRAVAPLYGKDADRYLTLEAGHLSQLLSSGQAARGLGLCPVGGVAGGPLRDALRLDDGHLFLQALLGGAADHEAPDDRFQPPYPVDAGEVAVVGMAGRYPGADDVDRLWENLRTGHSAVGPTPAGRPDGPVGGWLTDVDTFDNDLFGIAPAEAAGLDPQLRLLLQVVWTCLEDAGHTSRSLGRVGVFVGLMWHDHRLVGTDRWRADGTARISGTGSEIANRVSHVFDLRGPSLAVDTSCSSSLTALHLAVQSLRRGECDAAVVAASNLLLHPYHAALLRRLDLIAETPPRALDATSGGWPVGEGVGAVLLRRLGDARDDRDRIHGVVESTWVGHLGGTTRYGVPDVGALADSLREAVRRAGVTPADLGYVECAAAGATLSDAAEVEAVTALVDGAGRVAAGTLKPNLGHAEAASGLAQLTKVLLQLRHGRLAPTLLAEPSAALVDLDTTGVRFVDRPEPWPDAPRRALVNALGATGSVGHVVVRAAEEQT